MWFNMETISNVQTKKMYHFNKNSSVFEFGKTSQKLVRVQQKAARVTINKKKRLELHFIANWVY